MSPQPVLTNKLVVPSSPKTKQITTAVNSARKANDNQDLNDTN